MKNGLNYRLIGYYRDKDIKEVVSIYKCLNAEQIEHLKFKGLKSSKRVCQRRLKKLVDTGRLHRWRYALEEPYAYYVELADKTEQMEHLILLNWVIIWLECTIKDWEVIYSIEYEINYNPILRCDAFVAIENKFTKTLRFCFIEMDRGWSANKFDKIEIYNKLFDAEKYKGKWWVQHTTKFPTIIIATTTPKRVSKIKEHIKFQNKNNLMFKVYNVYDIRKEVLDGEKIKEP